MEAWSSSIYYQSDIWTPTRPFADFVNNETLLGEVGCGVGERASRMSDFLTGFSGHKVEGIEGATFFYVLAETSPGTLPPTYHLSGLWGQSLLLPLPTGPGGLGDCQLAAHPPG